METSPVIMLVGGPNQSTKIKDFYYEFTRSFDNGEITEVRCKNTVNTRPTLVLAVTPCESYDRDLSMYSWKLIFCQATIILDFGDWTLDEIHGTKPEVLPHLITWSGDNQETMERILAYVNKR
jgi:hypothetical protein